MLVEAIPLTDFVHGDLVAREGHKQPIEEHLALELERAGLVRINLVPALPGTTDTKAADDGAGRPLSASPADPASRETTLHLPASGGGRTRKPATS